MHHRKRASFSKSSAREEGQAHEEAERCKGIRAADMLNVHLPPRRQSRRTEGLAQPETSAKTELRVAVAVGAVAQTDVLHDRERTHVDARYRRRHRRWCDTAVTGQIKQYAGTETETRRREPARALIYEGGKRLEGRLVGELVTNACALRRQHDCREMGVTQAKLRC